MKYTKRLKNLCIHEKDFKILNELNTRGKRKILPLAEDLNIPRTTVSFRLRKMEERSLVRQIKVGGHVEWQITNTASGILLNEQKDNEFNVAYYDTEKDTEKIFEKIINDKSEERVYFIEPYKQTKAYIKSKTSEIQSRITELFKKKKNISEGISSGKNIDLLKSYSKKVLKSMHGRMAIVHTIPDEYLSFEDMIIVYCNTIYLFNFETSVVVEIKSASFARSMKSIIMALEHFGDKINLNDYIKELLVRKVAV